MRHIFQISVLHYWECFEVVSDIRTDKVILCNNQHSSAPEVIRFIRAEIGAKHNSRNYQKKVPSHVTCTFMFQPLEGQKLYTVGLGLSVS